jgi:hypothetical protein
LNKPIKDTTIKDKNNSKVVIIKVETKTTYKVQLSDLKNYTLTRFQGTKWIKLKKKIEAFLNEH